jgi:hypothetical protein
MRSGVRPLFIALALAASLVAAFLVGMAGQAAGDPSNHPPGLAEAIAVQERHTENLLEVRGVVGTAVGLTAGGQPAVKVYTRAPGVRGIPSRLNGFPVDVEVTGELVPRADPKAKFDRPVPIGVSSGTERLIRFRGSLYCTVGTLGARVSSGSSVFALSNAHVYALEGSEPDGAVQAGEDGDRILQPGRADMTEQACGSTGEINDAVIGRLHAYEPIVLSRSANNTIDAAIASTTSGTVGTATPVDDGYGTPSSQVQDSPAIGQKVQKYGRTTALTKGEIDGINATVIITYDQGQARFVDQIVITPGSFSAGGDSGSLIVTDDEANSPVGLLFAGSSSHTIANPITDVLERFGVSIDGTGAAPVDPPENGDPPPPPENGDPPPPPENGDPPPPSENGDPPPPPENGDPPPPSENGDPPPPSENGDPPPPSENGDPPPPPENGDPPPPSENGDPPPPSENGDPPPPPSAEPLNLPAGLVINRAQVQVGASTAQRHGVRRLVVRGSLNPAAAGERPAVRFRAAGRQILMRPIVQPNGTFQVNRRLRGPQRRVGGGQLRLRYAGNDVLRAASERLRAARRAVRLRIARLRLQENGLVVAGRVLSRAGRQARIQVEFNRPNGDPAQIATRARVNRRGRFRTQLRVPPAVRDLGGWVAITHPGRARLFGQRRGRAIGG